MQKWFLFTLLLVVFSLGLLPAYSQDTQPDVISLERLSQLTILLVEIPSQNRTDNGVRGTFTIENPLTTFYLEYELKDVRGLATPATKVARIWHRLGIVPPKGVDLTPASEPAIKYDVHFTSDLQWVEVESRIVGPRSAVFNALVIASSWIPALDGLLPDEIAEALGEIEDFSEKILAIAETVGCFAADAPELSEMDNCILGVAEIFDSSLFWELVSQVALKKGIDISGQSFEKLFRGLNAWRRWGNIADTLAYFGVSLRGGSFVNRYVLRPMTTDPALLPPFPPLLVMPIGPDIPVQPLFEWRPLADIASYEIQVSTKMDFSDFVFAPQSVTTTLLDSPITLAPNTTYYWRVRGVGRGRAGTGEWSTTSFVTQGEVEQSQIITPLIDLAFVIDTTGSMHDDIDAVKAQAIEIVNQVSASTVIWQIGVITYRDHPQPPYGDPGDYVTRTEIPFSSDRAAIVSAIHAIEVDGGGDMEESVYSGIMAAIGFPWRDGAKKAIIVMGDAPPHEPEPVTGYTLNATLQAAYDLDPANIYPLMIADDESTRVAFQSLADGSSGRLFRAATADVVVETVFATIESIAFQPELSRLLTIGGFARVNTSGGDNLRLRAGPGTEFDIVDRIPYGTTVTVLGGPEFHAPYLWWNIRTPEGKEGWSVEAADGLVTLIPVLEETASIPIIAFPPTSPQEAARIYTSLWSLTEFQDINSPGTIEYEITIEASQRLRFPFLWCGNDASHLQEILLPLTVKFSIDGIELTNVHVQEANLDGVCHIWQTVLTGWPSGGQVVLEIHYNLSEAIFDGSKTYDAGDYYHRVTVNVQ